MAASISTKFSLTRIVCRQFYSASGAHLYWYNDGSGNNPVKKADQFILNHKNYTKDIPRAEREKFPGEFDVERPKGRIYDKKPFKMLLEAGKKYSWCTCGFSKSQPLCDGTHKMLDRTSFEKKTPKFRPLRFQVEETKEYWLCNCKQTSNSPFCDGTHRREDIQEAVRS